MRRLTIAVVLLATIAVAGCERKKRARKAPAEDNSALVSVVNVNDPRASVQLVRGFYNLEDDTWRWTMTHFSVTLRTPPGASQQGAKLELKGSIPERSFQRLGPIAVSATVDGQPVLGETISRSGGFVYSRLVPSSLFTGDSASVEFTADKALPPTDQDGRELSLIVTSIGLLPISQ
jgi:hypothetical protein